MGCDIVASKGQCTYELRHMWGLDGVLRDDGLELKNREDHRHHAVDALVIALTNRKRLQELARVRGTDQQLAPPWNSFRHDAQQLVNTILVSHRVARKVAGALHEETLYGPTTKPQHKTNDERPHAAGWIEQPGVFVVRKKVEDLTPSMVGQIRDAQVKEIVLARLRERKIDPATSTKFPKDIWQPPLQMVRKAGRVTTAANIIQKVRVLRSDLTIQPIRGGSAFVKPGNTHHICLFELPGSTSQKPKREMIAVSMLQAIARVRRKEPLIQRQHPTNTAAKFMLSLSYGEMVEANIRGTQGYFVFRTAASTQGQIYFTLHTDARPSSEMKKLAVKANTFHGSKVAVDPLGRVRRATD